MARHFALVLLLTTCGVTSAAKIPFVLEERAGRSYTEGAVAWRDALLRASVGGCKQRVPRGARLRPRIHDCVINQVHVTNLSQHVLECRVTLVLPAADDAGRTRIEHTQRIEPRKERWMASAYGPAALVPVSFVTTCTTMPAISQARTG